MKINNFIVVLLALIFAKSAIASNSVLKNNPRIIQSCEQVSTQIDPTHSVSKKLNNLIYKHSYADIPQATIWWAIEQFDPFDGKLIENWLTHPKKRQINLIVDSQLWTTLDYFDRYRLVNQFGTIARKYSYSLNILDPKEQCLATYKYNTIGNPPKWELRLEELGKDSLQVSP